MRVNGKEVKRDYYQVFWEGCPGVVHDSLDAAIADISESMKYEIGDAGSEETGEYQIKAVPMTEAEFAALPEFDGY